MISNLNYNSLPEFRFLVIINIILFTVGGCSNLDKNNTNLSKVSIWQIIKEDSIEFENDYSFGNQFIESSNTILAWAPASSQIMFFNPKYKTFIDSIRTYVSNPTSVRTIYYVSKDSLLLYPHDFSYLLHLIDKTGVTKKTFNLSPRSKESTPRLECNLNESGNNLFQHDRLYMAAYSSGESRFTKKKFSGVWVDIKTSNYDYFSEMPREYFKHYWGGIYFWHPFITGDDFERIIISYPNSHKLYYYSLKSKSVTSVAGGSSFIKKIEPLSDRRMDYRKEIKEDAIKFFFTTPSYSFITYDKFRNTYYRMAQFPNENFGFTNSMYKPVSIIILDHNFSFLGETKLNSKNSFYSKIIVTRDAIIIPYFNPKTLKNGLCYYSIKPTNNE